MQKKQTQNQKYNELEKSIAQEVCLLTGMDEETHHTILYNTALDWLAFIVDDKIFKAEISKTKMFWKWWRSMWLHDDKLYLQTAKKTGWAVNTLGQLVFNNPLQNIPYIQYHNPYVMASGIDARGIQMQDSCSQVIKLIHKEIFAQ